MKISLQSSEEVQPKLFVISAFQLSLFVDDIGVVYSHGQILHDEFAQNVGTATVDLDSEVLVLKAYNAVSIYAVHLIRESWINDNASESESWFCENYLFTSDILETSPTSNTHCYLHKWLCFAKKNK